MMRISPKMLRVTPEQALEQLAAVRTLRILRALGVRGRRRDPWVSRRHKMRKAARGF